MKQRVTILGIPFESLTVKNARRRISHALSLPTGVMVFTPNSQILWHAYKNPSLSRLLKNADLLLPDGTGVILASRLLGNPLPCRITGIDMAEWLLQYGAKKGFSFYFLGGKPGVAQAAANRMKLRIPYLRVVGTHHGYFDKNGKENARILAHIRRCAPDILFVCFGFPEQEKWIIKHTADLPSLRLAMGLGGTLDVWSGTIKRAPKALQALGMEWLWRSLREPKRIKSLACLPKFLAETLKTKGTPSTPLRSVARASFAQKAPPKPSSKSLV